MEFLDEYVFLCRTLGALVDWVQGAGGNISIKNDSSIIIKQSGALLAATTTTNGWVVCDLAKIRTAFESINENLEDAVIQGTKPSIETFLHLLPTRIVVHLHPMNLMHLLCKNSDLEQVPYIKPGLNLAKALFSVYTSSKRSYFLQNHGIVVTGNSIDEIFDELKILQSMIPTSHHQSDLSLIQRLAPRLQTHLLRPVFSIPPTGFCETFIPFTPDIVVFLQRAPLFLEIGVDPCALLEDYVKIHYQLPSVVWTPSMVYTIGNSIAKCVAIEEILLMYQQIPRDAGFLTESHVDELITWNKEKDRKSAI